MAKDQRFLIVKNKDSKEITYFDYEKIDGYSIKPNPNMKFEDAIDVSRMIIINPSLIDKVAMRKINKKFEKLITMFGIVCEDDDESGEGYILALTEADKFRQELNNKYKKFIADEKLELMLKKLAILEDELKLRLQVIENKSYESSYNMDGKAR